MGQHGPVPKRSTTRAGHRAKADRPDAVKVEGRVPVPAADSSWHPQAAEWYRSLRRSGQSRYFEPSDWQYAQVLAHMLSAQLSSSRPSAQMMKALFDAMEELGSTESSRRRMRIEVERQREGGTTDEVQAAEVAILAQYRT